MRLVELCLSAVGILLILGLSQPVQASDHAALARLQRIARGQWLPLAAPTATVPFALEIRAAARRHGLSGSLLAALVRTESGFDPRAVSHAGAQGLGQLMPETADELAVRDPFNPAQNLDGAARYLANQLRSFQNVRLALAAYHAGPERAGRGLASLPTSTLSYIARVLRYEREYRHRRLP